MMAADVFAQRLASDDNWSKRMLFPDKRHAIWLPQRELGRAKLDLEWVDKELNYEQQVLSLGFLCVTKEIRGCNRIGISR